MPGRNSGAGGTLRALVVVAALACTGCADSPSGPGPEVYSLTSINGAPLPGPFPDVFGLSAVIDVTAGTLTLRPEGTFREVMTIRCRSPLPPGTECEITGNGTIEGDGVYSRSEGFVRYPAGPVPDAHFPAAFDGSTVTIHLGLPPSLGGSASFVLEYRR